MIRRVLMIAAPAVLAACATAPECREPTLAERALFGEIVSHNEDALADRLPASQARLADELRALEPDVVDPIFGRVMGDASVRSVLMQPPLCVVDQAGDTGRTLYVFPSGRFTVVQNEETPALDLGRPGVDHAACRFEEVEGAWTLADACLATFAAGPAS